MKKNRFTLEKHEKMVKGLMPNLFEIITFMVSAVLFALGTDLKLPKFQEVTADICFVFFIYIIVWCVFALVFIIRKKRYLKHRHKHKEEVDQNNEN